MMKCIKCGKEPQETDKIAWKCVSCGKSYNANISFLRNVQEKKNFSGVTSLLKCKECGKFLDDGNEKIFWKCSCGNVQSGRLEEYCGKSNHNKLIKCPECGREISGKAKKCVHCGYPIKKIGKKALFAIIGLIGILFSVVLVIGLITRNSLNEAEKKDINNVYKAISEIGEVTVSTESSILQAEKLYNSLSDKCKERVSNYNELVQAREIYNDLKSEDTNKNKKGVILKDDEKKSEDLDILKESENSSSEIKADDITETEKTIVNDGSVKYPFGIGEYVDVHFWGYSIESYGDARVGIIDYNNNIVTMECQLKKYGRNRPLNFPNTLFGDTNEDNFMIYLYPCEKTEKFTISENDFLPAIKSVRIASESTEKIKFRVSNKYPYVALVWYTWKADGGEHDFTDGDLKGHIAFFDLNK